MSHATISAIKGLIKPSQLEFNAETFAANVRDESDRAVMIICGGTIENYLVRALKRVMPNANSDEQRRLFDYNGPLGTFSSRIQVAQALGIINRITTKRIIVIKELRNVSAHAAIQFTFANPELVIAMVELVDDEFKESVKIMTSKMLRRLFVHICIAQLATVLDNGYIASTEEVFRIMFEPRGTSYGEL